MLTYTETPYIYIFLLKHWHKPMDLNEATHIKLCSILWWMRTIVLFLFLLCPKAKLKFRKKIKECENKKLFSLVATETGKKYRKQFIAIVFSRTEVTLRDLKLKCFTWSYLNVQLYLFQILLSCLTVASSRCSGEN